MSLKLWKIIGIIGTVVMVFVDLAYLWGCFKFLGIFYSKIIEQGLGMTIFYTIVMGFIPFALMIIGFGVLYTLTLFFLTPAIDF